MSSFQLGSEYCRDVWKSKIRPFWKKRLKGFSSMACVCGRKGSFFVELSVPQQYRKWSNLYCLYHTTTVLFMAILSKPFLATLLASLWKDKWFQRECNNQSVKIAHCPFDFLDFGLFATWLGSYPLNAQQRNKFSFIWIVNLCGNSLFSPRLEGC